MNKLTIKQSGVPAGNYKAKFVGCEPTTHIEYGQGIRFQFEIVEGPCAGQRASRVTTAVPTPQNNAGRMLADLTGMALKANDEVDVGQYTGRVYHIVVEEMKGGATRVRNVFPVPAN